MALTKTTRSMIDAPVLNIKDYGAVGDGVANDTAAFLAFKADCSAKSAVGELPAGTYLIDPFAMGSNDTGLTFRGSVFNSKATPPTSPGYFGPAATVLKLRSASPAFVTISGCYFFKFENIAFDGGNFADNVIYFPGSFTVTNFEFTRCDFYGATPTTGVLHKYDGSIQIDRGRFVQCQLQQARNAWNGTPHLYNVHNVNSNAFMIDYHDCFFQQASTLIRFGAGSCNIYLGQFSNWTTRAIVVDSITQPFIIQYPYTEYATTTPFFEQTGAAGVIASRPIIMIGLDIAAAAPIILNCQQQVNIYGGFVFGGIQVNPMATYGVHRNIIDGVTFSAGYTLSGSGAITHAAQRNCMVDAQPVASTDYNALSIRAFSTSTNAGPTIAVTDKAWINIANTVAQTVTGLTGGLVGQEIMLYFTDGNTTLQNSATLRLQGSTNVTPTANSVLSFIGTGAAPGLAPIAWVETSRSIK